MIGEVCFQVVSAVYRVTRHKQKALHISPRGTAALQDVTTEAVSYGVRAAEHRRRP